MTAYLSRAVRFTAAHRYYRPEWSEEENIRRFGDAAFPGGHRHDYRCEVTVRGPLDAETGMVVDLEWLDALLREEIVERFDGVTINEAVEHFAPGRALPTTENLSAYILGRLAERLPDDLQVYRVRVYEDPDLWADAYGMAAPD